MCLSGLADLDALLSGVGIEGGDMTALEGDGDAGPSVSALPRVSPAVWPDDMLTGNDGLLGRAGRESSVYVTAGIVPAPIQPLSLWVLSAESGSLVGLSPDEEGRRCWVFSCRDRRSASRRSIRSLHCSSSCRRLSTSALSVSERGM